MAKTPPAPGATPTNAKQLETNGKPIADNTFTVGGDPTKNYIVAKIDGEAKTPILVNNDGKLYVRKDLAPAGSKGFRITVTPIV